jgi:hypothetical protein
MAGKGSRASRHFWLSSRAAFTAERLAEIAGVPAGELVEMVLLELAGSGEIVEAEVGAKGKQSTSVVRRGPASAIPIERGRRLAGPLGRRIATLRLRSETLRQHSRAVRLRGERARENSTRLRLRCGGAAVPGL